MKFFHLCAALIWPVALAGQESSVSHLKIFPFASVVITEIMADPDPSFGLPVAEFVEVFNNDSVPVNLSGWTFFDGSVRTLPGINLAAGEYLIICANADTSNFIPYGNVVGVSSLSLTNDGEKLSIRNSLGQPTDSVVYSDLWYGSSYKKDGGWSLERIDNDFTCQIEGNWQPSVNANGGTPGAINSINGIFVDDIKPVLLRAFCPDSISVVLVFSESLDPLSVPTPAIFNTEISIDSISIADASITRIKLHFANEIQAGAIYTVSVSGVTDCPGNIIESNSTVKFGIKDSARAGTVVINEILFNPFTDGYDFVELFHNGTGITDLSDFKIATLNLTSGEPEKIELISEEPLLFFPGDYMVLTEKPQVVSQQYLTPYPHGFVSVNQFPSMNVDEGYVAVLINGKVHDSFHYYDDYHFELLDNVKGISLERIHPSMASDNRDSWHSASPSAGFATPGFQNSQHVDLESKQQDVFVHPEIFSPDFDGYNDVVTFSVKTGLPGYIGNLWIYNASGQVIYKNNVNRLLATHDSMSWDGIDDNGELTSPGIYVAFIEVFNLEGEVKKYKLPFVLAIRL